MDIAKVRYDRKSSVYRVTFTDGLEAVCKIIKGSWAILQEGEWVLLDNSANNALDRMCLYNQVTE